MKKTSSFIASQSGDGSGPVVDVSFLVNQAKTLKSLSGWKKSHRLPDSINGLSESFVAGLSASDYKADLDRVYDSLKESFGFRRRDLSVMETADGGGTITTPYFSYSISVAPDPNDPATVMWTRMVHQIRAAEQIASNAFSAVFDNVFDTVQASLSNRVDIEDFIDAVEAAEIVGLKIEYDRQATYCNLKVRDVKGAIKLTEQALSIVYKQPQLTRYLVQSFDAAAAIVFGSREG